MPPSLGIVFHNVLNDVSHFVAVMKNNITLCVIQWTNRLSVSYITANSYLDTYRKTCFSFQFSPPKG